MQLGAWLGLDRLVPGTLRLSPGPAKCHRERTGSRLEFADLGGYDGELRSCDSPGSCLFPWETVELSRHAPKLPRHPTIRSRQQQQQQQQQQQPTSINIPADLK
jgi:hypothetical protein